MTDMMEWRLRYTVDHKLVIRKASMHHLTSQHTTIRTHRTHMGLFSSVFPHVKTEKIGAFEPSFVSRTR